MLSLCCSLLLVRLLPRPVLLASVVSRAGFSRSLWRVCSLSVPPYCRIVRLPVRSTSVAGRRRVASLSWFASIAVACCLPWLGRGCGGSVFLSWVLLVVAVSMASAVCVISVVPVAYFALVIIVGRHGLIVVGRCLVAPLRRRSSWLVVVPLYLPSVASSSVFSPFRFHPPLIVSLLIPFRPVLLVGRRGGGRGGFSPVPCVAVACGSVLLVPFGSRWAARLIRLLAYRLGILRGRCRWHGGAWLLCLRPRGFVVRRIHCG